MENLLDLANQDETQPGAAAELTAAPETAETEATAQAPAETESEAAATPQVIEEIDTAPKAQVAKALPAKAGTKPTYKREEPPPNPLLLDPYEWDKCTITVGYSLLPNKKVSVSVHNH